MQWEGSRLKMSCRLIDPLQNFFSNEAFSQSAHYRQFQQYCSEAYIILRRRAELLMNLMMLMKDASIPDISGLPGLCFLLLFCLLYLKTPHASSSDCKHHMIGTAGRPEDPERQLYKFWERFHLEMSNEEAYAHMQSLIIQSQTAFVPQMVRLLVSCCPYFWCTNGSEYRSNGLTS